MQDACIVLEDADLKLAASNIVKGGFSYSGQRCTAVKVVLAIDKIADELVAAVAKGVDGLSVGKPEVRPAVAWQLHGPTCHASAVPVSLAPASRLPSQAA